MHHNERLRLFGVLMTLPHNLEIYKRLLEGNKNRAVFNDLQMALKSIFTKLANDFNNDDYVIALPSNAIDVKGLDNMDPNDHSRIRIHRDYK